MVVAMVSEGGGAVVAAMGSTCRTNNHSGNLHQHKQ